MIDTSDLRFDVIRQQIILTYNKIRNSKKLRKGFVLTELEDLIEFVNKTTGRRGDI